MNIDIKLQSKFLRKKIKIEKDRGHNIYIGGGDGSGRSEFILHLLNSVLKNNPKKLLLIDTINDIGMCSKAISILLKNQIDTSNIGYVRKTIDCKTNDCSKIQDFSIEKNVSNYLIISLPCLEKCKPHIVNQNHSTIYDLINNLPVNEDEEIPIIIDNITHFKDEHFDKFKEVVWKANSKGYFFIIGNWGAFNMNNFERNFCVISNLFQHSFILKSHINLDNYYVKNLKFKIPIIELQAGQFYYLKHDRLQSNKPFSLFYDANLINIENNVFENIQIFK